MSLVAFPKISAKIHQNTPEDKDTEEPITRHPSPPKGTGRLKKRKDNFGENLPTSREMEGTQPYLPYPYFYTFLELRLKIRDYHEAS